jgi:ubiquinone/menaquinone biosynthesis C-methylase UbiE
MKRKKEKNIQAFNKDIKIMGQYLYTDFQKYSAYVATKRQSRELIRLMRGVRKEELTILDVGCGDGVFTFELFKEIKPKKIIGFDSARSAIEVANKKVEVKDRGKIIFQHGDVYDAHRLFGKNSFDIIVIRGVLHHLYDPQKAIKSLSFLSKKIIVLEPNGFNPILKVIEKVSSYHREHEERSYWPPKMNRWFLDAKFKVKKQLFFGIVPYFCPKNIAKPLNYIEQYMEQIPFLKKFYCGTNLIYFEK